MAEDGREERAGERQTPAQQFESLREGLRQMDAESPARRILLGEHVKDWREQEPPHRSPMDRLRDWWQERQGTALETQGAAWRAQHTERLSQIVAAKRAQTQEKEQGHGY